MTLMGPIVCGLQSPEAPHPRRLRPVSDAPERRIWNTGKGASKGAGMPFLGSQVAPGHCFGETSRDRVASFFLVLIFCLLKTEGTDWISGFADEAHRIPVDPGKNRAGKQKSRERRTQAGWTPKPNGRAKARGCLGDAVRFKGCFLF